MNWSNNQTELTKQVKKAFKELGFEGLPKNVEQLDAFDEMFKDYPYQCDAKKIDPMKIIKNL